MGDGGGALEIGGEARRVHAFVEVVEAPPRQRAEIRRAGVFGVRRLPAARRGGLNDARLENAPVRQRVGLESPLGAPTRRCLRPM